MKSTIHIVNAFVTDKNTGGNPAGVVLNADSLTDTQMQKIATAVGASETVFVLPSSSATHRFRFFTPTQEVELCGHATVACWSLMYQTGRYQIGTYSQETLAGFVDIKVETGGNIFIRTPTGKVGEIFDPAIVASALGVQPNVFNKILPPRFNDQDLMICVDSEKTLDNLQPNTEVLKELSKQHGFYDFHIFSLKNQNDLFANVRNFCPILGIPEDAATGTTNGNFLSYLKQLNKLPVQPIYIIEQGKAMGRTSRIYGKYIDGYVWIGGKAVVAEERDMQI